jgi:hypothetical protein
VIPVRFTVSALLISGLILLLLAAGCADVNVQKKVGDFGTAFGASSDEQKAITWFKSTYGDPTTNNDKPARFVEPLITTGLDANKLPKDKVTTFPQSGGSVYFFVIYDNFKKGDPITVSWTYLENGKEVTSVQQQAGGDFGRFIVEFQKPDSGWGKGKQRIMVTGDGATSSVDFTIGDALQTTPLPYNPSGSSSTASTGSTSIRDRVTPSLNGIDSPAKGFGRIRNIATVTKTMPPTLHEGTGAAAPQIDTNNDANNCGKIGNVCTAPPNANPYCYQGQCTWDCFDEHRYCGNINEGCIPLYNSNNHCGSCDKKCSADQYCNVNHCEAKGGQGTRQPDSIDATGSNGNAQSDQVAQTAGCSSGQKSCNGNCVDVTSDISNCGICGFKCPAGFICTSKLCVPNAEAMCNDFPCPPLTTCKVWENIPVCAPSF